MTDQPLSPDGGIRVPGTDRVIRRWQMLTVLLASLAMALMAISSINVALPSIEQSIGAKNTDVQWMLSGYALAYGMVLVAAGRTGDVLGRSTWFVVGVVIFTLGSLGCALGHTPAWLNWMRVLQGVGAGVSAPQVNGMIVQYFRGQERAHAFALFGLTVSASVAVAPTLTGALIGILGPDIGWRASFLWNVPIGILTVVLSLRWLPFGAERERKLARERGERVRPRLDLDPVGMVLLSAAVLCVMLPFMVKTAAAFILLAVGVVLGAVWVWWERSYLASGSEPMVDLGLFNFRSFTNGIAVSGALFLGATSVFVVLAIFLQNGLGVSALAVGLIGLPNAVASAVTSMWAGRKVLARGRLIIVGSFAVYLIGLATCMVLALFLGDPEQNVSVWWLMVPLALCGAAMGAITSANQTLSLQQIPPRVGGTAGAVKQVAERLGTAIGNAMITAVFFALAPISWTQGFTGAYTIILVILTVALVFAIIDLRMLGDGESRRHVPAS